VVVIVYGQRESRRLPFMARPEGNVRIRRETARARHRQLHPWMTASDGPVQTSPSRA